jgi:glucose dehydrogenase
VCPAALGSKDQQPAAFNPKTKLFYVPTNHVCMDYEPFAVEYADSPMSAHLSMYPPPGEKNMGNFIAWDASEGKIVWSKPERFSVGAHLLPPVMWCSGTLRLPQAVDLNGRSWRFRLLGIMATSSRARKGQAVRRHVRVLAAGPASAWLRAWRKIRTA